MAQAARHVRDASCSETETVQNRSKIEISQPELISKAMMTSYCRLKRTETT
jgi:hypothetical protein